MSDIESRKLALTALGYVMDRAHFLASASVRGVLYACSDVMAWAVPSYMDPPQLKYKYVESVDGIIVSGPDEQATVTDQWVSFRSIEDRYFTVHYAQLGPHVFNYAYISFIELLWPGCTWRCDKNYGYAHAIKDEIVVGIVMRCDVNPRPRNGS